MSDSPASKIHCRWVLECLFTVALASASDRTQLRQVNRRVMMTAHGCTGICWQRMSVPGFSRSRIRDLCFKLWIAHLSKSCHTDPLGPIRIGEAIKGLKEARNVAQLFTQLFNFIQSLPSIEFSMMKLFVALSCAVAALAQGISIGAPAPGATLAAGSDVVVSVIKPVSFLSSLHI